MELAKERHSPNDSQIFSFFDNVIINTHDNFEEGEKLTKNIGISRSSSTISSPNSLNSINCHQQEEAGHSHSLISFMPGFDDFVRLNGSCFLRFDEQPYSAGLEPISNVRLLESFNSIQTSSTVNMYNPSTSTQENKHGEMDLFGWDPADHTTGDVATQESTFHKRPHKGESMQANKKQCNSATEKAKSKSTQPQATKDPQSIAAKNRRERISERLKVLQDLVPNGSKVDLVTMLEKAISYVQFLQLQVKVLATDEFWPVQGGEAPELSQVKEAIDAILSSSQKERKISTSTVK